MKLIYCYIKKFRNIENQEVCLSDDWNVHYSEGHLVIQVKREDKAKKYLYGNGFMRDLHVVVGKTGSGKTNFLQLIGMDKYERLNTTETDAYFLLYKMLESTEFAVEIVGIDIKGLNDSGAKIHFSHRKECFLRFKYTLQDNAISNIKSISYDEMENTCVINAFDRYAFAHCPYDDERREGFHNENGFLPRMVAQFGKSSVSMECECLYEYLSQFPKGSIKRQASFEIQWDNWQDKIEIMLDEDLLKSEYWTYKSRAKEQRDANYRAGKYKEPIQYPPNSTPKSRFLHDLMTDFAIYLRKWAECIDPEFPEKYYPYCSHITNLGIDNPRVLPDGEKLSILKRIDWLCQYLDYHTDELTSNRGLMWQIGFDIRDIFHLLGKMDDKYFTDEKFSIPVMDIDLRKDTLMRNFFERIEQYRPDEVGVFTQQLLPYYWTYVSSGEYQYAKVWGILEEYGVKTKIMTQGQKYEDAIQPNLILLMDEPESYMHPEMCRQFINRMQKVLNKRNPSAELQVILSTHSPFMLSDVLSSQIVRMDYDEMGKCIILQNSKPSFAANIHSIMADGFFLKYTIGEQARLFLSEKFALLQDMLLRKDQLTDEDYIEIYKVSDLLPEIGDELIRYSFTSIIERLV